jgi:hypothetical protein
LDQSGASKASVLAEVSNNVWGASIVGGATESPAAVAPPAAPPSDLFICTGGPATGVFVADVYFSGGTVANKATAAIDTSLLTTVIPQTVLQSERYGAMTYTIPGYLAGKTYTVTLYFVETYVTGANLRTFNVAINGTSVLSNFDIFATAGAMNKAVQKSFAAIADASGRIVIAFTNGAANNAKIDGIAITTPPNTPPTISAIADQSIACNSSTAALSVTVGDAETPAANLTLVASSSAPAIVPPANVVLGGSGANRTVTVTPAAGQSGAATITITVTDANGGSRSTTFIVTVNPPDRDAMLDRNNDGISDVWAALYPTAGGPTDDPDGDGANNLTEALAGTDPFSAASQFVATTVRDASGNLSVRWFGIAGKHYFIETSTDMNNWEAQAAEYTGTGAQIEVIVRPAGTIGGDRAFWRVIVIDMESTGSSGLNDWEKTHMDMVATVGATAGANGSISPTGTQYVAKGGSITYTITANPGYVIDQVLADSQSVGSQASYTFTNITAGAHSLVVSFKLDGPMTVSPTVIDLGCTAIVTVSTSAKWTTSSDQSWLTAAPALGTGNGTFTVSGGLNLGTAPRYAVITVNGQGGSVAVNITQKPVSNLALGKQATASSSLPGYPPANAVDSSAATRWASEFVDTAWIMVDLGASYRFCQVGLVWEASYGKSYEIQTSNNGTTWTAIYSTTTGDGGTDTIDVNATARYVRMFGSQRGTNFGYSLNDFRIMGTPADSDLSVVDLTQTKYFPPYLNQSYLGTCDWFAIAYGQMTYTMNRMEDRAADSSNTFSPKWGYNMICNANSYPYNIWFADNYNFVARHGSVFLSDLPYDLNYRDWPTDSSLWRKAIAYRLDRVESVPFEKEAIKKLLQAGEVLVVQFIPSGRDVVAAKNNPADSEDDAYVGEWVIRSGTAGYDHTVALVGYNDHIWTDVNEDGIVQPEELGAFKLRESINDSTMNRGSYRWVAYNAVKDPTRTLFAENQAWRITMRKNYRPRVLAQIELNSPQRDVMHLQLGRCNTTNADQARLVSNTAKWEPYALGFSTSMNGLGNNVGASGASLVAGGNFAFDGGFTYDLTELLAANPTATHWFLRVRNDAGQALTIKSFKIIYPESGITLSPTSLPGAISAGEAMVFVADPN